MILLQNDLKICIYKQGVMLIEPNKAHDAHDEIVNTETNFSVLHDLSFNVYIKDADHKIQYANSLTLNSIGCDSLKDIFDKTISYAIDNDFSAIVHDNNNKVIHYKRPYLLDEEAIRLKDRAHISSLSIKLPLYSSNRKIVGIFGFGLIANRDAYANAINQLLSLKLFPTQSADTLKVPGKFYGSDYFTRRELDILNLSARGKTAKDTATILSLSKRTVEHYIENIKQKLNVKTKSEMIEIFIDKYKIEDQH